MNTAEVLIENHLNTLDLKPERLSMQENLPSTWQFLLTPHIISELLLYPGSDCYQLQIITTMDCQSNYELDTLAAIIAPFITPCSLVNSQDELSVKLLIMATEKSIPALLSEGIIVVRHFVGIAFTSVVDLIKRKKDLVATINKTLNLLQRAKIK